MSLARRARSCSQSLGIIVALLHPSCAFTLAEQRAQTRCLKHTTLPSAHHTRVIALRPLPELHTCRSHCPTDLAPDAAAAVTVELKSSLLKKHEATCYFRDSPLPIDIARGPEASGARSLLHARLSGLAAAAQDAGVPRLENPGSALTNAAQEHQGEQRLTLHACDAILFLPFFRSCLVNPRHNCCCSPSHPTATWLPCQRTRKGSHPCRTCSLNSAPRCAALLLCRRGCS